MKRIAETVRNYPFACAAGGFFVLSCAAAYLPVSVKTVCFILCAVCALLLFLIPTFGKAKADTPFIMLTLSLAAACALSFYAFDVRAAGYASYNGLDDYAEMRITAVEYTLSYSAKYRAVITKSVSVPEGTEILVTTDNISLEKGDMLSGDVRYHSLAESGSAYFDGERYYLPKGIMLTADEVHLYRFGHEDVFDIKVFFDGLCEKLTAAVSAHTNREAGGMASAVMLGNKERLGDNIRRDFRRIGVSHLLVVSGTHFSVIVSFAAFALSATKLKRRTRAALTIPVIILFMGITGFTSSVIRAGIMHIVAQLGVLFSRKATAMNSLAVSGAVMILINPFSAVDCGLQLSYAATLCCILYSDRVHILKKAHSGNAIVKTICGFAGSTLATAILTAAVTTLTMPLMWLYFGEISLLSIPMNLIFVPLMTGLMYITGAFLLLYPLKIFIAPIAALMNVYCGFVEKLASHFAARRFAVISIDYGFAIYFLIPLALFMLIIPFAAKRERRRIVLTALCTAAAFFVTVGIINFIDGRTSALSYLPEKINDGFVLKSGGKVLLCDVSDASVSYSYNLTNEASAMNCAEIEALVLTHYHPKQTRLVERLCSRYIVRYVVLPEPDSENGTERGIYEILCDTAQFCGSDVVTLPVGEKYEIGNSSLTLFEHSKISRSSHPVTAALFEVGGKTVLYSSCSFGEGDESAVSAAETADFVILGRHSPVYKNSLTVERETLPEGLYISESASEYVTFEADGIPLEAFCPTEAVRITVVD